MRILVIEDERRMAELLRQGLMEEGHSVAVAFDGREGLALAESTGVGVRSEIPSSPCIAMANGAARWTSDVGRQQETLPVPCVNTPYLKGGFV